jgi:[ribosomal protein S18]-alanine N-acetyltransferase
LLDTQPHKERPVPTTALKPHLRWMVRFDLPDVLAAERASFETPWTEADFLRCLRQRNCNGYVAIDCRTDRVAGYMVYTYHPGKFELVNLAVHPDYRRQGVGAKLIGKLAAKCLESKRNRIGVWVHDVNLTAHLFFRAMSFEAVRVERGHFPDGDAYRMVCRPDRA